MSDYFGNIGISYCLYYYFIYYLVLKICILRYIVYNLDQNCFGYIQKMGNYEISLKCQLNKIYVDFCKF